METMMADRNVSIYGYTLTADQIAAGEGAMVGRFTYGDVRAALSSAGVPQQGQSGPPYLVQRAADRLLQRARKAGRVEVIGTNLWQARP